MRQVFRAITGLMLCVGAGSSAWGAYPDRPIHWVVGFATGGGADTVARLVGQKLTEQWGQQVIIENRPGADGTIAGEIVAKAAPDGYTIDMATPNHTVTPSERKLSYDAIKSFTPVTLMGETVDVLVSDPALPINSVPDLIAYAKAHPGKLNFGSTGAGGAPYLQMLLFMKQTGTDMINVNYTGTGTALVGLLGSEVQLMFSGVSTIVNQVKAGKLKALAVSSKTRVPGLPDVPTMAEAADMPSFDGSTSTWYGVLAPAGTPRDIVDKLQQGIATALRQPDVQQRLASQGFITVANTPDEFAAFIAKDIPKWAAVLSSISTK